MDHVRRGSDLAQVTRRHGWEQSWAFEAISVPLGNLRISYSIKPFLIEGSVGQQISEKIREVVMCT